GLGFRKATAAGGTILAEIANNIVWTFGSDGSSHVGTTLFSYSLVKPLLQYAGRAYALENLTQAERNLLANVRRMEQFRQGFYISVVIGGGSLTTPSSGSVGIGSGRISAGSVGGFYGLLKSQMELVNQRANVDSLKDSLDRMQANCDANRITSYQVDQTRQSLYRSQLNLLTQQNSYRNAIDQFKITLGLPPELHVEIRDPLLDSFELIAEDLKALQKRTEQTVVDIRSGALKGMDLQNHINTLVAETKEQARIVRNDVQALLDISPKRRETLDQWASQKERWGEQMDLSIFDSSLFDKRVENIVRDAKATFDLANKYSKELLTVAAQIRGNEVPDDVDDMIYAYNGVLLELILVQGRARLDSITLEPIYMDSECAISIAMTHRLDWMNARAALVDRWRQIEHAKNALKAGLKVTFDGSIRTTDLSEFHGSTTSDMHLGVAFDAPITRLKERNSYRRALLSYYQAHREFVAFEDNARENIREIIRKIDLCQMSFELQRASVLVSMSQYDQRRLQLERPPKPKETSSFGDSFARDLIDALDSLLTSQNQIMNEWLQYEAMRMTLDYALGTMQIDENGQWIDPGSMSNICPMQGSAREQTVGNSVSPATNSIVNPFADSKTANDVLEDVLNGTSDFNSPTVPTTSPFTPEEIALPPVETEQAVPETRNSALPSPEYNAAPIDPEVTQFVPENITTENASPELEFLDEDAQIRDIVEEADEPEQETDPTIKILSGAPSKNGKPAAGANLLPEKTPELEPIELPDAPLPAAPLPDAPMPAEIE
ncbi:MAG: TolC family protein, partial [Thermoguttaceae bacterium]|nr:TolC family protein [Thermoguttaceae bacterium]